MIDELVFFLLILCIRAGTVILYRYIGEQDARN